MNKKGFTLVELIVAMFVGAVIMAAIYGLMVAAQKNSSSLDRRVITQQDTRAVLDMMAMEIRMASFNPRSEPLIWGGNGATLPGIPACWGAPVNNNKGIQIATANSLVFAMDLNGDGSFGTNEYVMYSYDGATALTRASNCGTNDPLLGGTERFTNIRNATAVAGGIPLFRYFSATGELAAPINIPAIRRILITIASETEDKDSNTGQPKRLVYSTNVIVRNHVLSPPYPAP